MLSSQALAQQTYLYVVDVGPSRTGPHQVLRYDADGSNPQVFIDAGLSRPQDILFIEERMEKYFQMSHLLNRFVVFFLDTKHA